MECRYRGALIGRLVTGPDGFLAYRKAGPAQRREDAENRRFLGFLEAITAPRAPAPHSTHPR